MRDDRAFTHPTWRLTRWLADAGPDVPADIRDRLVASLFGTLPIFAGGVANSVVVAGLIAWRSPTTPVVTWFALELLLGAARGAVLVSARRRAGEGRPTPTDLHLTLALAWAASIGYGGFVCLLAGDWTAVALVCLSAGAAIGGICFRNFGAPRLTAAMILVSLGPIVLAAPFSGEPIMLVALAQIPMFFFSMKSAAFKLNGLLVATMRAERENDHQARHDVLTGLANRVGLMRAMDARTPDGLPLALLYLDLDGFKAVNDAHGHMVGDQLLAQAAERLKSLMRGQDVAARIGGDEFVVIAHGVRGAFHAQALGERLIRDIAAPYVVGEVQIVVGASVGVALTPEHGDSIAMLLDQADAALYRAKAAGKSCCVVAPPNGDPAGEALGASEPPSQVA